MQLKTIEPKIRLWSRIGAEPSSISKERYADIYAVQESVKENLIWLLNANCGDSPACPLYGLPDISQLIIGIKDSKQKFCSAIGSCISKNEPRIKDVNVKIDKLMASKTEVHFRIEYKLKSEVFESGQKLVGRVDMDANFILSQKNV
jgi:type VI secretion system lysozyme-like protein